MLLIDDLLLMSFDGLLRLAKKLDDALEQEHEKEEKGADSPGTREQGEPLHADAPARVVIGPRTLSLFSR
ncbi:hypothetical protein [Hyalangium versicolor]|uniref:hypothetical protein n=1 Tax=Hyalangium versicolor TaxID=2861190 RepID=UPI001CCB8848|nr:hypothetical protein [Hyalangium versicolor]